MGKWKGISRQIAAGFGILPLTLFMLSSDSAKSQDEPPILSQYGAGTLTNGASSKSCEPLPRNRLIVCIPTDADSKNIQKLAEEIKVIFRKHNIPVDTTIESISTASQNITFSFFSAALPPEKDLERALQEIRENSNGALDPVVQKKGPRHPWLWDRAGLEIR